MNENHASEIGQEYVNDNLAFEIVRVVETKVVGKQFKVTVEVEKSKAQLNKLKAELTEQEFDDVMTFYGIPRRTIVTVDGSSVCDLDWDGVY